MGALHEGHLSLVKRGSKECEHTIISIFVNPLQFGPSEDFAKYPRVEDRDLELAKGAGAEIAFLPAADELLQSPQASVHIAKLSERWEGARRPGHFNGVATIVAKLFNIVRPHRAYFGEKDFQQCAVITALVRDLNFPVELTICETIRESDGLALSSRNAYLSPEERAVAPKIFEELTKAATMIRRGGDVARILALAQSNLILSGFLVDYFSLVDSLTLEPISHVKDHCRLITAVKLGGTWLIDNVPV